MSIPSPESASSKLGIIILGASTFPQFPKARWLDNESFARSAAAFRELIASPGITLAGTPLLLDLFDSGENPVGIIRQIRDFLKSAPLLSDVLIYYCGHGDFLPDGQKTYYLALKATEPDNEAFTALPLRQTRLSLELQLARKRVFLVLDCCFAGQAVTEWQSDGLGSVIEDQVFQAFPRRGTALIAASAKGLPALALGTEPLTMFTGTLVQIINEGLSGHGPELSFRDVFTATRIRILDRYGQKAAVPAIHAPHQPDGDISFDPFFVNKAFRVREIEPSPAETENFELAVADLERLLPRTRLAALETLSELLSKTRSPAFKARLIAQLEAIGRDDDSSSVRASVAGILAGMAPKEPDIKESPAGVSAELLEQSGSITEKVQSGSDATTATAQQAKLVDAVAGDSKPKETDSAAIPGSTALLNGAKPTLVVAPPKNAANGFAEFLQGILGLGALIAFIAAFGWTVDRLPYVQSAAVYGLDQLRAVVAGNADQTSTGGSIPSGNTTDAKSDTIVAAAQRPSDKPPDLETASTGTDGILSSLSGHPSSTSISPDVWRNPFSASATDFGALGSLPRYSPAAGSNSTVAPAGSSQPGSGFNWDPGSIGSTLGTTGTLSGLAGNSTLSSPFSKHLPPTSLTSELARLLGNQALLTETLPNGSKAAPSPGDVQWESSTDSAGRADVSATANYANSSKLTMQVYWRPEQLPSGSFSLGLGFPGGSAVEKILGIWLRDDIGAVSPLLGSNAAPLSPYLYFEGSSDPAEAAANHQLLSSKRWMDIDVAYANGTRATFSLERDTAALKLFADALASWTGTPSTAVK